MPSLRFCRSCAGPRPRAAIRCPWCLKDYTAPQSPPDHLFASPAGEWRHRERRREGAVEAAAGEAATASGN